jgi:hypothetical protein
MRCPGDGSAFAVMLSPKSSAHSLETIAARTSDIAIAVMICGKGYAERGYPKK